MQRKTQIPDYPRYAFARQRAYKLLCELRINRLPIDPWQIARNLRNVHVCKWTELRDNCHDSDPLNIDAEGADAKTHHQRGSSDYLVVYDDREQNYQRVRWTIAHEIGHIVLGHLISFEATALCRGSLTEKDYKVLEREADCFAANLLAPSTIVRRLSRIKTRADLMEVCDLSVKAASNCLEDLRLQKSGKKLPFPIKEEDLLFRLFYRYINETNGMLVPTLKYDDLEIDEKYDDFIECDYWDFVVMTIRKWKLEKELFTALEGSLALYDCENMVIFVKDSEKAVFAKKNECIILEALKKYADSCVECIEVKVAAMR